MRKELLHKISSRGNFCCKTFHSVWVRRNLSFKEQIQKTGNWGNFSNWTSPVLKFSDTADFFAKLFQTWCKLFSLVLHSVFGYIKDWHKAWGLGGAFCVRERIRTAMASRSLHQEKCESESGVIFYHLIIVKYHICFICLSIFLENIACFDQSSSLWANDYDPTW